MSEEQAEATCDKCKNPSPGDHSCPFQEEFSDNMDPEYCNCCDDCRRECLFEI